MKRVENGRKGRGKKRRREKGRKGTKGRREKQRGREKGNKREQKGENMGRKRDKRVDKRVEKGRPRTKGRSGKKRGEAKAGAQQRRKSAGKRTQHSTEGRARQGRDEACPRERLLGGEKGRDVCGRRRQQPTQWQYFPDNGGTPPY